MAAGYRGVVVAAIAALGDDGVIVSPEDYNNFEALIGEYFSESDSDSDESGSEDSECEFVSKNHYTAEDEPDVFETFTVGDTGEDRYHEDIFEAHNDTCTDELNVSVSVVSRSGQSSFANNDEQSASQPASSQNTVAPVDEEARGQHSSDEEACAAFVRCTCGCKKANRNPCSSLFTVDHYILLRAKSALLTHDELDMVLLGSIMSTTLDDSHSIRDSRHKDAKRRKVSSNFMHHGHNICKVTNAILYGIGINHWVLAIRKHYQQQGLEPRTHQNSRRLPPRTLSFDDINRIVKYLQQYAEQHAILLPGRVPGCKRDDVKLLPSSNSKKMERSYYCSILKECADNLKKVFTLGEVLQIPLPNSRIPAMSNRTTFHYSFDMALLVHYPSDPFQPGPIYFLTPRKCTIFGICCEVVPRQVTYLIDEASNVGKGGNIIISMIDHFLKNHGFGETSVHFHADNCAGQNKNRYLMFYLMWRILTSVHEEIKISFLPVGHTKFAPDWCFSLFKRHYRHCKIGYLDDIVHAVNQSAKVNVARLVGRQDGTTIVPMYDWSSYFDEHTIKTALKGITKMHHFRFTKTHPGKVFVKNKSSDPERCINILRESWNPTASEIPEEIVPRGLSLERRWYLHDKIREFCPEEV